MLCMMNHYKNTSHISKLINCMNYFKYNNMKNDLNCNDLEEI